MNELCPKVLKEIESLFVCCFVNFFVPTKKTSGRRKYEWIEVEEDTPKKKKVGMKSVQTLTKIETMLELLYEFFVPETYLWQKGEEEINQKY